ncbi:MAG: glycoside hydrolase family 2 TIM barrel-domain containing protein [Bacteroidales bacterium]
MKSKMIPLALSAMLLFSACNLKEQPNNATMKPAKVELKEVQGSYSLYVNGEPFFVKGAGVDDGDIAALAAHGANSFRTWMDSDVHLPADQVLSQAQEQGLMVMMGLPVGKERHGFDYNDEEAVQKQFEEIKQKVLLMKDHPALLGWGIGNELNLRATNMKVWDAVEEIAAFINEVDGNHPTTTMLAGIGKDEVEYITKNCPNVDFLSIQMYADIINIDKHIESAGYTGPYLVTEWGATGHWEVPVTSWDAPIENTSSEKARDFKKRYETAILGDTTHCLGSYVFLWGQKQERTPTWYGLFTEDGMETEPIDVMHSLWNAKWPENRCPQVMEAKLDGKTRYDNIKLKPGRKYVANYHFTDPDGDPIEIRVDLMMESTDLKDGGDLENRPDSLQIEIISKTESSTEFIAPDKPGPYRLFIYALDGNNHAATVNIPFFLE